MKNDTGEAPAEILQPLHDSCYWAVRELGVSMSRLSRRLGISLPAISKSVVRGKQIADHNAFIVI